MKLTIDVQMDNAAFDPDLRSEAQRILEVAKAAFDFPMDTPYYRKLYDFNGNKVGQIRIDSD